LRTLRLKINVSSFSSFKSKKVKKETQDCVSVSFDVPAELSEQFKFTQGQYLTFRQMNGEQELRRSYSICASPCEGELKVAVKKVPEGLFSSFMNENLKEGDVLEVMPPMGKFYTELNPENKKRTLLSPQEVVSHLLFPSLNQY
jgi:ring-1,2-phenylacetyl-CoA epoxidase subunit PaaE